jgi:multidrug efflux pump subunit AcrA (membrane-fusion protein)
MLNISTNSVKSRFEGHDLKAYRSVMTRSRAHVLRNLIWGLLAAFFASMFLPWTQNVRSEGKVTTLTPEQRPQTVHALIDGRIQRWFVQEGDQVSLGDTLAVIAEINNAYLDPLLISRTEQQLQAKEQTVQAYMSKVTALDQRIDALIQTRRLKMQQAQNKIEQGHLKVTGDSIELVAAQTNLAIAQRQFDRTERLYNDGLKSLTDLEAKQLSLQKSQADAISRESVLLASQNELINAEVELTSISAQYVDDIAKAESEKFSALSALYEAEATVTKIQNDFTNYQIREGMYIIRAPQSGFITEVIRTGIGEAVKGGEPILTIAPNDVDLAVEMYVEPVDLPLMDVGREVQIQFDGWPAVVFSGWPNTSYGTYSGRVYAIDRVINKNGKFRLLVAPDVAREPWPSALRVGGGASSMILLDDVAVGYELWRQINGFPPNFYTPTEPKP